MTNDIPPTRLPEGSNGYTEAAQWLNRWGYTVGWQKVGKTELPEIDGKLSNYAALCDLWKTERDQRFGNAPVRDYMY